MPTLHSFIFISVRQGPSVTAFTNVFQSSHRMWWFGCFGLFHLHLIINCSVCTVTLVTFPTFNDFWSKSHWLCGPWFFSLTTCSCCVCSILLILLLSGQEFHLFQRSVWQHCYLLLLLEVDSSLEVFPPLQVKNAHSSSMHWAPDPQHSSEMYLASHHILDLACSECFRCFRNQCEMRAVKEWLLTHTYPLSGSLVFRNLLNWIVHLEFASCLAVPEES